MSPPFPHAGEIFSLLTAIVFALSVVFFKKSGEKIPPTTLNLFKNIITLMLLGVIFLFAGRALWHVAPLHDYLILAFSGIVGIAVADTFFFWALNKLGAGLTAIVDCSYSPMIVLLSFLMLGERIGPTQMAGAVIIISGILVAFTKGGREGLAPRTAAAGITIGILGIFFLALGIVVAKPVLDRSPVIWASTVRLVAGTAVLVIYWLARPDRRTRCTSCACSAEDTRHWWEVS